MVDVDYSGCVDLVCMTLHKVGREAGISIPHPQVHVYLAGTIGKVSDPEMRESCINHFVHSIDELEEIIRRAESSNALPYLLSKNSADLHLNFRAMSGAGDFEVPAAFYSVAQFYSNKMGKKAEAGIFGLLALRPEEYLKLMTAYYKFMEEHPDFELTDEDFKELKAVLSSADKKVFSIPNRVKQKKSDNLLI